MRTRTVSRLLSLILWCVPGIFIGCTTFPESGNSDPAMETDNEPIPNLKFQEDSRIATENRSDKGCKIEEPSAGRILSREIPGLSMALTEWNAC